MARALMASGVRPGDRVALWSPNSARWIAASFGVYLAGAVLVPVNTRFKGTEAAHVLRRSGARILLGSTDMLRDRPPRPARRRRRPARTARKGGRWTVRSAPTRRRGPTSCSGVTLTGGTDGPWPTVRPQDLADIIFTSGTTGAPKGAMLAHGPSVRTYVGVVRLGGPASRRPLPVRLPVLPHRRLEVGGAGLRPPRRRPSSRTRSSTPSVVMQQVAEENDHRAARPADGVPVHPGAPRPRLVRPLDRCDSR